MSLTHQTGIGGPEGVPNGRGTDIWLHERPEYYDQLEWVHAAALLEPFLVLTPEQVSRYVDLGTGTGTILTALASRHDFALGIDISEKMLDQVPIGDHVQLLKADAAHDIPIFNDSVDLVTERMMLHDLDSPERAIQEAWRILRPGGQLFICENVTNIASTEVIKYHQDFERGSPHVPIYGQDQFRQSSPQAVDFLRSLFSLKHEPSRHLWSGEELQALVAVNCPNSMLPQLYLSLQRMSVANWLEKSGFPIEDCKQQGIMNCLAADPDIKKEWRLVITSGGQPVAEEYHTALLTDYFRADRNAREAMQLDASFYAAFANISLYKSNIKNGYDSQTA